MQQGSVGEGSKMRKGLEALLRQTEKFPFDSVLDIGTGSGFAARFFQAREKKVTVTGYDMEAYFSSPLPATITILPDVDVCAMTGIPDESFDAVWCSHVLEHVLNPGQALAEIRRVLKPGGRLFLILPEYAPYLVGGHVTPGWNIGVLMYVLILAGFEVRTGEFINHCWNVVGFVAKGELLPKGLLRYDNGDLELLSELFPPAVEIRQGMDAELTRVSWEWHHPIREAAETEFDEARKRRRLHEWVPSKLRKMIRSARR